MTHILFTHEIDLKVSYNYKVKPITEQWQRDCNNFKGTEQECIKEGKRKAIEAMRQDANKYCEPHYRNAPYESIYDY